LAISSISSRKDSFTFELESAYHLESFWGGHIFNTTVHNCHTRLPFPFSFTLERNWFGGVTVFNLFQLFHETCLKWQTTWLKLFSCSVFFFCCRKRGTRRTRCWSVCLPPRG
jgi:hypothetical protein